MISLKKFRNDFDYLVKNLEPRGISKDELLNIKNLDSKKLNLQHQIENLNFQRNNLITENSQGNKEKIKDIKIQIQQIKEQESLISENLNKCLHKIPNIPHNSLSQDLVVIHTWGKIEKKIKYLSYIEIGERFNLFDFSSSINIAGSGFASYKGNGEKLFRALIAFTLDENEKKGYSRYYLPVLVNEDSLFCTSQISKFSDTLFKINNTNKYLSPTGEVQLVNIYRNKLIEEKELPIKLTTNTNCFRFESVGSGIESKGLIRLYQFNKTENIIICKPENSDTLHNQLLLDVQDLLEKLNLPYRVVLLPNNDLGFSANKTYDIEVWFPSENKYREISSISNTLDFQSLRGKIRYKKNLFDKDEKSQSVHILNGSALAIDRLFAAILENHQDNFANIIIPEKLKKYLNFEIIS